MQAIAEPTNKKVLSASLEFISRIEEHYFRNGKSSIEISSEIKLASTLVDFPVRVHSPFLKIFEESVQVLTEAGICPRRLAADILPQHFIDEVFDEEIPTLVLSMEDLGVGFEVCLIPLALSLVVFIFELVYSKIKQIVEDYLTATLTILTFIENFKPGV